MAQEYTIAQQLPPHYVGVANQALPPYVRLLDSDIECIAKAVVRLMKQAQAEQHNDTANRQAASAENLAAAAKHHQSKTD